MLGPVQVIIFLVTCKAKGVLTFSNFFMNSFTQTQVHGANQNNKNHSEIGILQGSSKVSTLT